MRILLVQTWYPEFLTSLYHRRPELSELPFEVQQQELFATGFGIGDAYSHGLRRCGWEASEVICNADRVQGQWAAEHGLALHGNIHDRRRQIVAAQVQHYGPDVLYVFEWSPLGDAFLQEIRGQVRLLAGQIASPLPDNRTFAAYDLMLSSWPPIVKYFRETGRQAEYLRLGFDERVLQRFQTPGSAAAASEFKFDVTFVGGFAPSHRNRVTWLEELLRHRPVDIFAYGMDTIPPQSPIRQQHRGEVWGLAMYEILRASRVTLNLHAEINVRGSISHRHANNMRLYEATGVGACLLTERRENLGSLFSAGREVLTYESPSEAAAIIEEVLADNGRRQAIASSGQQRTLREHTYSTRMQELSQFLNQSVKEERSPSRSIAHRMSETSSLL